MVKQLLADALVNIGGWTTNKKIVVIESDDWGAIRTPDRQAFDNMLKSGIPVDKSLFCRFDTLVDANELESVYAILSKYKDSHGNHPVITANAVVANPDFDKIKADGFETYYYETVDRTLERYFPGKSPFPLWKEGIDNKLFIPQFHGREHVNVPFWLDVLKKGDEVYKTAFENGCWGISNDIYKKYSKSIQATFDCTEAKDIEFLKGAVADGLDGFEKLFGYRSETFIPNNYIFPEELFDTLQSSGVKAMQGMKYLKLPHLSGQPRRKIRRYNGQKVGNAPGMTQLVRNSHFEPSVFPFAQRQKALATCIGQLKMSFLLKKPGIISCHRFNFSGRLEAENRDINLRLLDTLIKEVLKRWPDVIFTDSASLAKMIK
ncbi:polysaccharide (de)acetylase [Flavobacterium sp.]|uniref:polysaccharide (de)acetylase n=1 Tax=Flavobacterium sp. TaxID=239 RepID=UPI0040336F85